RQDGVRGLDRNTGNPANLVDRRRDLGDPVWGCLGCAQISKFLLQPRHRTIAFAVVDMDSVAIQRLAPSLGDPDPLEECQSPGAPPPPASGKAKKEKAKIKGKLRVIKSP